MDGESLVREYLRDLAGEAAGLPVSRRAELVGEVREHIELALAEAGSRDEATVRTILDRLGSPAAIVSAERTTDSTPPAASPSETEPRGSTWGVPEVIALLLVTIGALVLPIVGPLAGLILLWGSARLTRTTKVWISALALVLAFALPVALFSAVTTGSASSSSVSLPPPSAGVSVSGP